MRWRRSWRPARSTTSSSATRTSSRPTPSASSRKATATSCARRRGASRRSRRPGGSPGASNGEWRMADGERAIRMEKVTIAALQQMKREGRKIVGLVVYDFPTAQIADRAGVDLVSVGDSVGANLWGQPTEAEVSLEELLLACRAVRRGTQRALVSCDLAQAAAGAGT